VAFLLLISGALKPAAAESTKDSEPDAPEAVQTNNAGAPDSDPRSYSLELGGGYSHGYTNGGFARFSFWEPGEYAVRFDFGVLSGFGESTAAFGGTYMHHLNYDTTVSVGLATSTGPLAPKFLGSVAFNRPFFDVGFSFGYARYEWGGGAYSNDVWVGAERWFSHWIVGGSVTHSRGQPGDIAGTRVGLGVTYYVWRKTYIGVGVDFGDEDYRDWLYGFNPRGVNLGFSRWFDDKQGVNVNLGHGWSSSVGRVTAIGASWFKEW
jgi:YaiO family outer membrane protein